VSDVAATSSGTSGDRGSVGLFGAGVIGSGWTAFYLARGYRVKVHDPAPEAEQRTRDYLDRTWPQVVRSAPGAPTSVAHERLTFESDVDAVAGVDIIHENGPESVERKQEIYGRIEASADDRALILSSSGGLMPSLLQADMSHPERLVVAHPLSPVYALPLVEILGGAKTSEQSLDTASEHLTTLGKHVIRLHKEVPGYLTNRLTFALVREAVHCLLEGVADAQAIEDAVVYGVTPRYVLGGALTSLAVAGGGDTGAESMTKVVTYFAPAIEEWWSDLGAPTMTQDVKDALVAAADAILGDRQLSDVVAERDAAVVEIVETFHS
jgi:3-hydroxyacyl-CoA dehydrogenase